VIRPSPSPGLIPAAGMGLLEEPDFAWPLHSIIFYSPLAPSFPRRGTIGGKTAFIQPVSSAPSTMMLAPLKSLRDSAAPELDLVVRVGCRLLYDAAHVVPMVLNVRPQAQEGRRCSASQIVGGDQPVENYGCHGHRGRAPVLSPGRTEIVHDALVAVSAARTTPFFPHTAAMPVADLLPNCCVMCCPAATPLGQAAQFCLGKIRDHFERPARVQAICDWLHDNSSTGLDRPFGTCRHGTSSSERYGVCRRTCAHRRGAVPHLQPSGALRDGAPAGHRLRRPRIAMDFTPIFESGSTAPG